MAHDVFISHSARDKTVADAVCARLESAGIRCWVAPRDILGGADWGSAIIDAIEGSRAMVLVFSAKSNDSEQVKREIQNAVSCGVPILPLRIEDVQPSKSMRYFIGTQHWLDAMTPPLEAHLDKVAGTVAGLLSAGDHGPPSVAPATRGTRAGTQWIELGNGVHIDLVPIPAGTFRMGSPDDAEPFEPDERPCREIAISKPFSLGVTPVTQAQWEAVMCTTPWKRKSYIQSGPDYPAVNIDWVSAGEFCRAVSDQSGLSVRLPTEAEWEYACRAGSDHAFCFGDSPGQLDGYAWYDRNATAIGEDYAHPVGRKRPNARGLHDMHGNIWEWCSDWYGPYDAGDPRVDPAGPEEGDRRVLRGGSVGQSAGMCRSATRLPMPPDQETATLGLRIAVDGMPAQGKGTGAGESLAAAAAGPGRQEVLEQTHRRLVWYAKVSHEVYMYLVLASLGAGVIGYAAVGKLWAGLAGLVAAAALAESVRFGLRHVWKTRLVRRIRSQQFAPEEAAQIGARIRGRSWPWTDRGARREAANILIDLGW